MPGTVLGIGNTIANKTSKIPAPREVKFQQDKVNNM